MRLPLFIAWRYLFTKDRELLEWFTTAVSLLGVAIGVGTMIAVVGVIDGLRHRIVGEILSWIPQIEIENPAWQDADPEADLIARIKADPAVLRVEPILETWGWIAIGSGKGRFRGGLNLYGADRLEADNIWQIQLPGNAPIALSPGEVLISDKLTSVSLIGREATITGGTRLKQSMFPVYPASHFKIRGAFSGSDRRIRQHWAFIATSELRRFTRQPHGISYLQLKLRDPMTADRVKKRLSQSMPPRTTIDTWTEDFAQMFGAMRVMKMGMLLVMLMTIVVAALNIIGTLTLIIIQKTSEIGILKAMGASDRLIGRIFMFEGLIIGFVGAILGAAMGIGFLWAVQQFKIQMPGELSEIFPWKTIPVEFRFLTTLALMLSALVICTVAAMLPARHAAKLKPVVALRYD